MRKLQFSYSLGNIHDCFRRKGLVSMRNHPSYTFLFFATTYPKPINLHPPKFSSCDSSCAKILNDTLQEVWKHLLSLDGLKSLFPNVLRTSKYCSQITILLQERETDHSGSCKTDITKAPSRELQLHNIQLPIIYSVARFSAGINQGRFLACNRVKLIYAS